MKRADAAKAPIVLAELISEADIEAMVAVVIKKAKAGDMAIARLLFERVPPVRIAASDIDAVIAAVTEKAKAGDKTALRLMALYKNLDHLERR